MAASKDVHWHDVSLPRLYQLYKYVIAFENLIEDDYVTEKLFEPLDAGAVPVYLGAPSVGDILPHPEAAIVITLSTTPADLASLLIREANNWEATYRVRHAWRQSAAHVAAFEATRHRLGSFGPGSEPPLPKAGRRELVLAADQSSIHMTPQMIGNPRFSERYFDPCRVCDETFDRLQALAGTRRAPRWTKK